jgi:TolB protein
MRISRLALTLAGLVLLLVAFYRIPSLSGGQAAVSLSLPGHEDLSFWVNHNGLIELDFEGEAGFGDMARLLMRRRANRDFFRSIRSTFTFRVQDLAALDTPDLFRAAIEGGRLIWRNEPKSLVVPANRIFNLPLVVVNRNERNEPIRAELGDSRVEGEIGPGKAAGFFLKIASSNPISTERRLVILAGERRLESTISLDVRPLGTLRVRLFDHDGSTGYARVYLTAADGLAYAPRGAISRFAALSAEQYFHAAAAFELDLPAGQTLIEATRGQEYRLASRTVEVQPGKTTEVELRLERWVHMAAQGWYSSDSHIHANYTAPHHQVITPADVRLQTLAEDLNNANLMVANSSGGFIHDEAFFEGKPHALSRPGFIMYWNEEMRNAGLYGHMSFFNLKSLVHPIYTGFNGAPHWEDYPPNYATAKAAQDQGGAVTYVHPGYQPNLAGASCRELPVDLALGQIDAIDVVSNNPEQVGMEIWGRLLNCGFRLAISAGTDSFTNVADHYTPGGGRVYVRLDGPMDYAPWISNYKRGRSFASNGPVIFFTLDGKEPGGELRFPAGARKLRVRANVRTQVPLDKIEVVVNGRPVVSGDSLTIDREITLTESSWVAVRALGPWHRLILNDDAAFAHTSPVYVYLGDRPIRSPEDARFYVDWIDQLIDRVEKRGRFATPEKKQEVVDLFRRARQVFLDRAAPPGG